MGREIVYCSHCGARILASEFGEDLAGTVEGRDYCRECMKAGSGQAGDAGEPREKTPSPGRHTPPKPIARPPGPPGTTRMPLAKGAPRPKDARPPWKPARDTSKRTLVIVAAVVLAVLLILVMVVLTKRGSGT